MDMQLELEVTGFARGVQSMDLVRWSFGENFPVAWTVALGKYSEKHPWNLARGPSVVLPPHRISRTRLGWEHAYLYQYVLWEAEMGAKRWRQGRKTGIIHRTFSWPIYQCAPKPTWDIRGRSHADFRPRCALGVVAHVHGVWGFLPS